MKQADFAGRTGLSNGAVSQICKQGMDLPRDRSAAR
jgi:hypothetical protein